MPLQPAPAPHFRRSRIIVFILLGAAFALLANLFSPFQSAADPLPFQLTGSRPSEAIPLGRVMARDLHLLITATSEGPRYTVTTSSGRTLASDLDAEDVYRLFPDLTPTGLHAGPDDPGIGLMLAEPRQ